MKPLVAKRYWNYQKQNTVSIAHLIQACCHLISLIVHIVLCLSSWIVWLYELLTINSSKTSPSWCSLWLNSNQTRVWHSYGFWYERISEYICVKKMTRTNIRIYSYEIFWYERISEYIRIKILIRTNIRINIWIENIWIFEYIRHSLD